MLVHLPWSYDNVHILAVNFAYIAAVLLVPDETKHSGPRHAVFPACIRYALPGWASKTLPVLVSLAAV
jgi:hypothetical protein